MVWCPEGLMNACFAGGIITVALRWYVRICLLKRTGLEDFLVTGALLAGAVWFACFRIADQNGFGSPVSSVPEENRETLLKVIWFGPAWWGMSTALCKASIVWQYRRVFPMKSVRKMCDWLIVFLIIYGTWSYLGCIFRCFPLQSLWDRTIKPEMCLDMRLLHYSCYIMNLTLDIAIFSMPIPFIRALQIPQQQKRALMVVFTFGAFTIFASIMRLVVLPDVMDSDDLSNDARPVTVWSGIEMYTCIVCACLAVLRPLAAKWFPSFVQTMPSSPSKRSDSNSNYQRVDSDDEDDSIPWDDPMLAKTIQTYRTIEITSERVAEWPTETRASGNRTECTYGEPGFAWLQQQASIQQHRQSLGES